MPDGFWGYTGCWGTVLLQFLVDYDFLGDCFAQTRRADHWLHYGHAGHDCDMVGGSTAGGRLGQNWRETVGLLVNWWSLIEREICFATLLEQESIKPAFVE